MVVYRNQYNMTVCISLIVFFCAASATLVVKPRNTSALEQHRVQLDCSTSKLTAPVSWQYIPVGGGGGEPQDVFINGILLNGYKIRFQIQGNMTTGAYNLIIPSVQFSDAGTYRCRDEDGRGEHVDANLHITENTDLRLMPEYAEAQVGERVQLNCTTYYKTEPVNWQHIPLGEKLPVDVYFSGNFRNNYTTGYDAQTDKETGINSLTIMKVNIGDGGLFRCIEKQGLGQHKDANLTVIDQTEDFDSSTYTYEPVTPKSSTGNNQNDLWALLVLIVVPVGILIAVLACKKKKRTSKSRRSASKRSSAKYEKPTKPIEPVSEALNQPSEKNLQY